MLKLLTNGTKRKEVEETLLDLKDSVFPISARRLAEIIGVSKNTILKAACGHASSKYRAVDFDMTYPYSKINTFVIADRILGYIEDE